MNVYMNTINGFGYSYIDWEYAKRKQTDPDLTFLDILNEKMDKLREEDKVDKKARKVNESKRIT